MLLIDIIHRRFAALTRWL